MKLSEIIIGILAITLVTAVMDGIKEYRNPTMLIKNCAVIKEVK